MAPTVSFASRNRDIARPSVLRLGRRALAVSAHVGRWNEIDHLIELAYAKFGRVDARPNSVSGPAMRWDALGGPMRL